MLVSLLEPPVNSDHKVEYSQVHRICMEVQMQANPLVHILICTLGRLGTYCFPNYVLSTVEANPPPSIVTATVVQSPPPHSVVMATVVPPPPPPHSVINHLLYLQIDGDNKELFPIGNSRNEPCLCPLMSGEILVLKDEMQISLDSNAKPTSTQPLFWSDLPISIEQIKPYIIALLPKYVEWVWLFVEWVWFALSGCGNWWLKVLVGVVYMLWGGSGCGFQSRWKLLRNGVVF